MTKRGRYAVLIAGVLFSVSCRPHAPKVADPRSPEEKEWQSAHDLEEAGRRTEAGEVYHALCGKSPPYPRACYDAALLAFETEPAARARSVAEWTLRHFPEEGFVPPLVKALGKSYSNARDFEAGIQALYSLYTVLKTTEAADSLLFEISKLHRTARNAAEETKTLVLLVETTGRWKSQLWDDSVWRLAGIAREQGRTDKEIEWLSRLLDEKSSSRLIGSYNSPFHDDALLRLGEIYLAEERYDEAYRTFMDLAEFSTSRMSDDGLLGAARTEIARSRTVRACRLLREAIRRQGSAARAAGRLSGELRCD